MGIIKLRKTAGQQLGLLLICALMTIGFDSVNAKDADIHTKVYLVPPTYLSSGGANGGGDDELAKGRSAKDILMDAGVTFAPGTSAIYNPGTSQVIVRNTKDQLDIVDAYFELTKHQPEKQLRIKVEWFELAQKDFNELMEESDDKHAGMKRSSNEGALRDKVNEMVEGGKATAIDTAMIVARSGQRAKVESVLEVIYPTKYVRSKPEVVEVDKRGKKSGDTKGDNKVLLLPVADAYETRNVGTTLEVDPVLGADEHTVDLSLSPEIVYLAGDEEHGVYAEGESEVVAKTPIFYTVKATTQVTLIAGEYLLFAVTSPINEKSERVDRSKKVMIFVKADVLYAGLPIKK